MVCSKCNSALKSGAKFCTVCGTKVEEKIASTGNVCVGCGAELKPGAKFCTVCGTKTVQQQENDNTCFSCGSKLKPGAKFCTVCGKSQNMDSVENNNIFEPTKDTQSDEALDFFTQPVMQMSDSMIFMPDSTAELLPLAEIVAPK